MSDDERDEVADLSDPKVTTMYTSAAGVTNKALELAISKCVPGADIAAICAEVDNYIEAETGKLYNNKKGQDKIEKGIAFPCCISVNEICGHFSPLPEESRLLQDGDLAKIDLACHIDGFIATCAHTVLIGTAAVSDARADVVHAAWTTAEAALRVVQLGKTNYDVTEIMSLGPSQFNCKPCQGVLSHELKKHIIDGNRSIISVETPEEKVEEFEFGMNEVYSIDVFVTTGEGRAKPTELRTTVFKRALENNYTLKTQKGRQFIHEVNKRFPTLPFSIRSFEDQTMCRVGISEANRHDLFHSYGVVAEKPGTYTAQFKYTVLLLKNGTKRITGLPFTQGELLKTEYSVQDEKIQKLLNTSANPKKAKKKKAKEAAEE